MTNDDFDDVYHDVYHDGYDSSNDRAVAEIGGFCYGLYSSDVFPYRLRGRYAVADDMRAMAARSVLFLRSGLEYEWPLMPPPSGLRALAGNSMFLGAAGIALAVVAVACALADDAQVIAFLLAIPGLTLLVGSVALIVYWPRIVAEDLRSFGEFGDFDVWPFLRRRDFDQARQSNHLFAK